MTEPETQKLVIVVTHGSEYPEIATLPFVVGNAALAMEARATIILQSNAVELATKGIYEHVFAGGFDPLQKLVATFLENGGTLLACIPCLEHRKIPVDRLLEGTQPVKAGRVVVELLEASSVVSY